jgi:hypothetical protein
MQVFSGDFPIILPMSGKWVGTPLAGTQSLAAGHISAFCAF